jgi:hypothetical protein
MRFTLAPFFLTLLAPLCAGFAPVGDAAIGDAPIAEAQERIIGGAPDRTHAYVVEIGDEDAGGKMIPFCTGTLVSRRTVLTAGHCYDAAKPNGGIRRVYFGPDNRDPSHRSVRIVSVVEAVRHPGFDPTHLTHDLTAVHLAEDAPVQPVPLLRETMDNSSAFVGPRFTFVGYGNDGGRHYDLRRSVSFPIERMGPADDVGGDTGSGPINATQFYYRVPHENTCDGDSGGPAFLPRSHVERLAGATSYGDPDCTVDGVDARTDAPEIAAFIQPMIDRFEGDDPCRADGVCNEACNTGPDLVDPDCAPNHCLADGICSLSCVDPPDPDCLARTRGDDGDVGVDAADAAGCSAAGALGAGARGGLIALAACASLVAALRRRRASSSRTPA